MENKEEFVVQEIHAVANGDGTYSADIIANFGRQGLQRFQTPKCYIKVDELVLDPKEQMPPQIHMSFNGMEFTGGFQVP